MAAAHVASVRGERVGDAVGYQVRFEDVTGPRTRLRYVTEGVLARRLVGDPTIAGTGCVVLDEFHERHLAADVALARLERLRAGARPDLRIVVMSATLDAEPVARYLGGCPRVRSEGRAFPVAIEHAPARDDRPLETQVADAVGRVLADGAEGDVLVFLPGAAEIRRAADALRGVAAARGALVLPLHGDLSADDQDRAVRPAQARKVVLSTNVAETGVTIDGVVAVVDSGLARIASHAPWSGFPVLRTQKVSRASAAQRAGRAGRTRPGRCLRLYTRADHDARAPWEAPEVARLDLSETVLELRAAGVLDLASFPWFEAPEPGALAAAEVLLARLHAVDEAGRVTDVGRRMLRYPLHPRLARLLVEAERLGVPREGAEAAALLAERDLRLSGRSRALVATPRGAGDSGPSDVLAMRDALEVARRRRFDGASLRGAGIDAAAARAVERARAQLERLAAGARAGPASDADTGLLRAVLCAFPDRVARRRRAGEPEVLLAGGGAATLGEESVVRGASLLVVVDAEERPRGGPLARVASAIEPEWLLDVAPERLREEVVAVWDEAGERVEVERRTLYDDLVLESARRPAEGDPAAARLLADHAAKAGVRAFADPEALDRLLARAAFVAREAPDAGVPALTEEDALAALRRACEGRSSFAALRGTDVLGALVAEWGEGARRALAALAPERVALPGGWSPRVQYAAGRPPWIEAQVQDLFGQRDGPRVLGGRLAVVLHLLAPSRRPLQVTTDLAGFWDRHWPAVRREMARRYPRHAWPEDPRSATPPARGPRRRP